MSIPYFNAHGLLPVGYYDVALEELAASHLVCPRNDRAWDHEWRAYLVENLAILLEQLRRVGIDRVIVGGSFVEDKAHPGDIDGYFRCNSSDDVFSGRLATQLNALDEYGAWTWDRQDLRIGPDGRAHLPLHEHYAAELYPEVAETGAIVDPRGTRLSFRDGFEVQRKTFRRKGLLRITLA